MSIELKMLILSSVLSLIVLLHPCLHAEVFLLFRPHGCIQTSLDQQLLVSENNGPLRTKLRRKWE